MFRARVFAITLTLSGPVYAQASGQDVATAQALFEEGKRLMTAGKWSEACPKLVESQRIDPGGGTLMAIALCHEGEGKTATAWADFTGAQSEARKDHRADRETAATEHIRALEPKLTRLRVTPKVPIDKLEIRRDGTLVGEAQWRTALPVDPGEHVFEASAPGKRAWKSTVQVRGEGATVDVEIPALEDEAGPPPNRIDEAPPPPPKPKPKPPPPPVEESSQKTWALVSGGLGVIAAGVGLGFGLSASSKWSDAHNACPANKCSTSTAVKLGESAGTAADVSTVLVTVGAVALVAGAVLWLTAPSSSAAKTTARVASWIGGAQ